MTPHRTFPEWIPTRMLMSTPVASRTCLEQSSLSQQLKAMLEVLGMPGHQGGRQGFLFREAKNPTPGSGQAHTQLKGV